MNVLFKSCTEKSVRNVHITIKLLLDGGDIHVGNMNAIWVTGK